MYKNSNWIKSFNNVLFLTECEDTANIFRKTFYNNKRKFNVFLNNNFENFDFKNFYFGDIDSENKNTTYKDNYEEANCKNFTFDSIIYDIKQDISVINYLKSYKKPIFFTDSFIDRKIIEILSGENIEFITPFLENDFFVFDNSTDLYNIKKENIYSVYNYGKESNRLFDKIIENIKNNNVISNNNREIFFITNHFFPIFFENGFNIEPTLYSLDNFIKIIKKVICENSDKIIIIFFTNQYNNFFQTILNYHLKTQNIIVIDRLVSERFITKKIKTILNNQNLKIYTIKSLEN